MMITRAMVILAGVLALVGTAGGLEEEPKGLLHYIDHFQGGMNAGFPQEPLQIEDVDRWARLLGASEAQQRFMLVEYQHFVQRHNEYMDRTMPEHAERSVALGELWRNEGHDAPATVAKMQEVDRANLQIRRNLIAIEHSLLDAIAPILTPEQQQLMPILRHESRRRNCRSSRRSMPRWYRFELREVWHESAAALAAPFEQEQVDAILAEYEPQLTELICQRIDLQFDVRYRLARNRLARREGTIPYAEARARYRRILQGRLHLTRQVRSLHERTAERIVKSVSEAVASAFRVDFKRTEFPEVYPDHIAIHDLFDSLLSDDALDDDQRDQVTMMRDAYAADHEQSCVELEAICIQFRENTEAGITGYETQRLPSALEPKLENRRGLSREYLEKLRERLGDEALERHAALIPEALREREQETVTP